MPSAIITNPKIRGSLPAFAAPAAKEANARIAAAYSSHSACTKYAAKKTAHMLKINQPRNVSLSPAVIRRQPHDRNRMQML
jgi:hypothetical protein